MRSFFYGVAGCCLLLAAWEILGRSQALGHTLPPLSLVLRVYANGPKRALLVRSASATLASAGLGYLAGVCAGVAAAVLAHLVPVLRGGLDRMAVLLNALPVIALGPVLIITAGRSNTPAALASVPVGFLLYVSTVTGLRSANHRLDLVFTTLGARRWQRLLRLDGLAAVPSLLGGMKIAAGGAMIGAIVGEWFGAPAGLGVVVINSMQNFQIPLLWATVLVIAAITLAAYGLLTLTERAARQRMS